MLLNFGGIKAEHGERIVQKQIVAIGCIVANGARVSNRRDYGNAHWKPPFVGRRPCVKHSDVQPLLRIVTAAFVVSKRIIDPLAIFKCVYYQCIGISCCVIVAFNVAPWYEWLMRGAKMQVVFSG